ncbi:hypothetical protein E3E22_00360 [Thermococcus sp. MV5]|nr:hypothetical protein [Thermococcus sp. MV5]
MPRGMGRGYRRQSFFNYCLREPYYLIDMLLLIGIIYFFIRLLFVALPYALGFIVLLIIRGFLRPNRGGGF